MDSLFIHRFILLADKYKNVTFPPQKLLQVITTFDDMYETLNDSLTAWWEYKGYTNNPRGCLLGTNPFVCC